MANFGADDYFKLIYSNIQGDKINFGRGDIKSLLGFIDNQELTEWTSLFPVKKTVKKMERGGY